ncbi:HNH endonuclease [Vibrio cholerae]|nr:HNH endonuclease [Vibrio cholerae]
MPTGEKMELISSVEELYQNIMDLGVDLDRGIAEARGLVQNGRCFVVTDNDGILQFSPSRYIGYKNNTLTTHSLNGVNIDGKETNKQISRVLKIVKRDNPVAESAYQQMCLNLGLTPPKKKRTFWVLPEAERLLQKKIVSELESADISKTEKLNLVKSRLGQGKFRTALLNKWGECCLTGVRLETALKASHIKPWSQCDNKERLDPNNGLLLVANADSLFDSGLISFNENGRLIKSKYLPEVELKLLLGRSDYSLDLNESQKRFMEYHRKYVLQK